MPEFHANIPEQDAWKAKVLTGEIELEEIDTEPFRDRYGPNSVQLRPAIGPTGGGVMLPALSLVAVPGRRQATLELAREIERRGFAGIYVPSIFGNMAQCTALALAT